MNKKKIQVIDSFQTRSTFLTRSMKGLIALLSCSGFSTAWASGANDDPTWEVKTIFGVTVGSDTGLQGYVNAALNGLYSIIGVLTVVRIILGAYKYMSAGGDPETISSAKDTIRHALTGLVLVLLAYMLTSAFIGSSLLEL